MIGLDTNVLVRFFTRDDNGQADRATALIESQCSDSNPGYITTPVLCELVWVLEAGYEYRKTNIVQLLRGIVGTASLRVENQVIVMQAIALYENCAMGFSDCLIAVSCDAVKAAPVFTFDKKAVKCSPLFAAVP